MKTSAAIGIAVLALLWGWLSWGILSAGGVNLKNLLVVAMAAIIIFVPLYKKYYKNSGNGGGKDSNNSVSGGGKNSRNGHGSGKREK